MLKKEQFDRILGQGRVDGRRFLGALHAAYPRCTLSECRAVLDYYVTTYPGEYKLYFSMDGGFIVEHV